jgi:hypothetical protein
VVVTLSLTLVIWEPIRKLVEQGGFYYGGGRNIYDDTLISLAKYTMYTMQESDHTGKLLNAFLDLLVAAFALALFNSLRSRKSLLFLAGVFAICVLSIIIQHHVMDTYYPVDRTALYLYPLLVLMMFFSILLLPKKWMSSSLCAVLGVAFSVNFLLHANLYKTVTWFFDSHTSEILEAIQADKKNKGDTSKIDYSWPFDSGMRYYLKRKKFNTIKVIKNGYLEVDTNFQYYIYLGKPLDVITFEPQKQDVVKYKSRDTLMYWKNEGVYLFKNRRGQ